MLCRFDRAIFQSDNGYCVFSYCTQDESVPKEARKNSFFNDDKIHFTAVGYHLVSTNVVEVELDGTWEQSKHGLQMSVTTCKQIVPTDQAGVLAYLSSGIIKGVGPEIAKAIVAKFGDKTMEVLEKTPQQLLSIRGIAKTKLKSIIASYEETKALSDLMIYLAPFGVSMKKAAMIKEEFGDQSLQIVKTDPFQLCRIKGFGFMTVDSIARKTKVSLKHPMRYAGAINYVLDEARVSGHLFLSVDETVGRCYDLLNSDCEAEVVSEGEIRQAISNERLESRIYVEGTRVYLSYERMCEVKAAKRIVSMILQEDFEEIYDLDEKIDQAEQTLKQKLAPSQRKAVKLCLSHPISIMTGGPGSGKTTTLRFILDIYKKEYPSNEILLAAPTGRASRRIDGGTVDLGDFRGVISPQFKLNCFDPAPCDTRIAFFACAEGCHRSVIRDRRLEVHLRMAVIMWAIKSAFSISPASLIGRNLLILKTPLLLDQPQSFELWGCAGETGSSSLPEDQ